MSENIHLDDEKIDALLLKYYQQSLTEAEAEELHTLSLLRPSIKRIMERLDDKEQLEKHLALWNDPAMPGHLLEIRERLLRSVKWQKRWAPLRGLLRLLPSFRLRVIILFSLSLAGCFKTDDMSAVYPPLPPIPQDVLYKFIGYHSGDSIKAANVRQGYFYFNYFTEQSYPGDTAHPYFTDLIEYDPSTKPVAQQIYFDIFKTAMDNAPFREDYSIIIRTHFKNLPDTAFGVHWHFNELQ